MSQKIKNWIHILTIWLWAPIWGTAEWHVKFSFYFKFGTKSEKIFSNTRIKRGYGTGWVLPVSGAVWFFSYILTSYFFLSTKRVNIIHISILYYFLGKKEEEKSILETLMLRPEPDPTKFRIPDPTSFLMSLFCPTHWLKNIYFEL